MLVLMKQKEREKPQDVTVRVLGQVFRCSCGCNVFRHLEKLGGELDKNRYVCNGCQMQYKGE